MSAEGIAGLAVGIVAIVASEWMPILGRWGRTIIASIGFILLAYSGILALEEYAQMKIQSLPLALIIVGLVIVGLGVILHIRTAKPALPATTTEVTSAEGGRGGSGEIFGNNGTIIGGRGGRAGVGGNGRGGDGGGGVIHGDGGTIIGGEGGSVDGSDIWFPPAQSGFIQFLEAQGQTPDFGVQYPGSGGASGGWLAKQEIVQAIRIEYFDKTGQKSKKETSKIEDVPIEYINSQLAQRGYAWRARIDRKYWYLYYIPKD